MLGDWPLMLRGPKHQSQWQIQDFQVGGGGGADLTE